MVLSMHKLQDAIQTTAEGFKRLTGSNEDYNRSMGFSRDRLKSLTHELDTLNDSMGQLENTAGRNHTKWGRFKSIFGKTTLGVGVFLQGLSMIPGAVTRSLGPLKEFGFAQMDLARKSIRGTAMMTASAEEVLRGQTAVHTAAVQIRKDTGLSLEESTQLAVSMGDAYALSASYLGENFDMTNAKTKRYTQLLSETAKITGLSASAAGEFNRHMMVNLRLSGAERERMLGLIHGVSRFGIKGTEAVKMIEDNYTKIMAMNVEDRTKFADTLLETAGIFKKAGIDYAKATERFKGTGGERMTEAALMAAFSKGQFTFKDYIDQKLAAEMGNEAAQFDVFKKQALAVVNEISAITGLTMEEAYKGIQEITKKGGDINKPEAQKVLRSGVVTEMVNTGVLKDFAKNWQDAKSFNEMASLSFEEWKKQRDKLIATDAKMISEVEKKNVTLDEGIVRQTTAWADAAGLFNVKAIEATRRTLEVAGAMEKLTGTAQSSIFGTLSGVAGGVLAAGVIKSATKWLWGPLLTKASSLFSPASVATKTVPSTTSGPLTRLFSKVLPKTPWLARGLGTLGLVATGTQAMETVFGGEAREKNERTWWNRDTGLTNENPSLLNYAEIKKAIEREENWRKDYDNTGFMHRLFTGSLDQDHTNRLKQLRYFLQQKTPHNVIFDSPIEHIDKKPPTVIFDSDIEQKVSPVIEHDEERYDPTLPPAMPTAANEVHDKALAEHTKLLAKMTGILSRILEENEKVSDHTLMHGPGLSYS